MYGYINFVVVFRKNLEQCNLHNNSIVTTGYGASFVFYAKLLKVGFRFKRASDPYIG